MESSFTFLRVRGIEIGANWSWLFVFALIAWSLGAHLFPRTYPNLDQSTYIVMGIVAAILFFTSILLHELGHAFRALKEGMKIDGITLWLFGGVARFSSPFPSAGAEFRIAIAGPVVSVLIAAFFAVITVAGNRLAWPEEVVGVTDYLARINAIVVAFNLVPALPLDGGRVLRAWLWHRQESFAGATVSAAKAGRAFGGLLIGVGILGFITGAGIGGIWFVFLGWFLLQAAQSEASYALLRTSLRGLCVRDLMSRDPSVVPPDIPVQTFVDEIARTHGHSTYPVVSREGLVGLMSIRLAGQLPPDERRHRTIGDVMHPRSDIAVLDPDAEVFDVLTELQSDPGRGVAVSDGRVVGILSRSDIARALEFARLRGTEPETAKRGAGVGVWIVVGVALLAAAAFLYHPPVAVVAPGEAFDVTRDITITGVPTDEVDGRYMLTSVRLEQPNGLGLAYAVIRSREVLPLSSVIPQGQDPEEFFEQQQQLFVESRRIAAAAAARAVGMDVTIAGDGVRIINVLPNSPADGRLRRGDVVTAVNGNTMSVATDLQQVIRSSPAGTTFTFTVERDGQTTTVDVTSRSLDTPEDTVGIGVLIETRNLDVQLPFEIEFEQRDIGGPSAGLAYALAIADLLEPDDVADGRNVAATGTIDLSGGVGRVGGVSAKADAAEAAGAALFLVPAAEVEAARGNGLPVRGVSTLSEALNVLR